MKELRGYQVWIGSELFWAGLATCEEHAMFRASMCHWKAFGKRLSNEAYVK